MRTRLGTSPTPYPPLFFSSSPQAARPNFTPSKTTAGCSRASALFIFLVMALVAAPIMSTLITSVLSAPERLGLVPTLMMNLLHFIVFYVIQIHLYL